MFAQETEKTTTALIRRAKQNGVQVHNDDDDGSDGSNE